MLKFCCEWKNSGNRGVPRLPDNTQQFKLLPRCAEPASAAARADAKAAAVGLNEPAERGHMSQFGCGQIAVCELGFRHAVGYRSGGKRSEEHTSELQSLRHLGNS